MKPLLALALASSPLFAGDCIKAPCSAAMNFAYDLIGTVDTRPYTWGTSASTSSNVIFKLPAGYRVRILRVYGDLTFWPRGTPATDAGDKVIGNAVGVLLGLSSTVPGGSDKVVGGGATDSCFLYIQDASKGSERRAPFDYDVHVGGLLEADNTMVVKFAIWLNSLGLAIHGEPTFTVVYQWEVAP